jgi:hypothetical protein
MSIFHIAHARSRKSKKGGRMDLSVIADFADLIAASAIIVSLVFVGYEMRMTRNQAELSNWRDLLSTFTDFKAITNDLDYASFLVRAHADYHTLNDAEKLSFGLYLEQGIHISGNFLKHNDSLPRKLVGLDEAIESTLGEMLTTPGGAAWWAAAHRRKRFMPETYVVVDRLIGRYANRPDLAVPD